MIDRHEVIGLRAFVTVLLKQTWHDLYVRHTGEELNGSLWPLTDRLGKTDSKIAGRIGMVVNW